MQSGFRTIQNPKMRAFFEKATAHIQQTKKPCAIKAGEPEFAAWGEYFQRTIGALPLAFAMAGKDAGRSFTVPTQWPEWFDTAAALESPAPMLKLVQPVSEPAE
jgi:hypothetical protein